MDKQRIHPVVEVHKRHLGEKRELLYNINEVKEMCNKGTKTTATVQHRVNLLEVESRELRD